MSPALLDDHLASCAECARWAEAAAGATRLARLDARPVPDLSERIAAEVAVPARRVMRRRRVLQIALLLCGLAQLAIGLPALGGDSVGMAMSAHGAHEAAAWNLGIGIAFVAAAWTPRRAAGLIALLVPFLAILGALSVRDYVAGAVSAERLATHSAALIGVAVLVLLDRAERALPRGWYAARGVEGSGDDSIRTVA